MADKVKPVPAGYHSVTPYLCIQGATEALDFYKRAFGAIERVRMDAPGGKIGHAEIQIGDSHIMLADEFPEMPDLILKSPRTLGASSGGICLYVEDVDALFKRAVDAGAIVKRPLTNQFYGDRSATLEDPSGHIWTISTHIEDVTPEEMKKRMADMMGHE